MVSIPKPLRLFPRDFALQETENKTEINEESKKTRTAIKMVEKKSLEDIISSNNYYDLSKKHNKRKSSIDVNSLFNDIIKTENINLGKKFKPEQKIDNDLQNLKKDTNYLTSVNNDINLDKNIAAGNTGLGLGLVESDILEKSNFNENL